METKYVKVPFEVELAKKITNGEVDGRVVTRDGRIARVVCYDVIGNQYKICALVNNGKAEDPEIFTEKGLLYDNQTDDLDLMLQVPEYVTFKDGDIIGYDGFNVIAITMADVVRISNDVFAHYHVELRNGRLHFYEEGVRDVLNVGARLATEEEKKKLIAELKASKEPKAKECLRMLGIEVKHECEFKPKDWVLCYSDGWNLCQFSHTKLRDIDNKLMYVTVGGIAYDNCIPYNEQTAHLIGTTDNWEEKI